MLFVFTLVQVLMQVLWVFLNKNRGVLGNHDLEIRDEGLVERTNINESMFRWSGLHKLGRSRNYLFIYVTENQAHFVPLRCFSSDEEAKSFQDEIQRRWKAAQLPVSQ